MNIDNDAWFVELIQKALINSNKTLSASELSEKTKEVILEVLPESSDKVLNQWKSLNSKNLRTQRKKAKQFEEIVYNCWKTPIDLLEMLIEISLELGMEFDKSHREAVKNNDYVFDVLTRLQLRACRIGFEILSLLKHGFADCAFARWRTLHEIDCVALFIMEHGQEVARRYIDYESVIAYDQTKLIRKYSDRLDIEPLTTKEIEEVEAAVADVCKRYGEAFKAPYGWIPKEFRIRGFAAIEKAVKLDHFRPYYKMACFNVHSGPKGILFKLGLVHNNDILAGPSNYGLADPGQNTAISLFRTTTSLLSSKPTIMRLIMIKSLQKLVTEICKEFIYVHSQLSNI